MVNLDMVSLMPRDTLWGAKTAFAKTSHKP